MRQPRSSEQSRYLPNEIAKILIKFDDADMLARMAVEGSSVRLLLVEARFAGVMGK